MKVLLVGRHQNIEPLGLLHLSGVARDAGWARDVVLVKNGDFSEVVTRARETRPALVAFSIWTGFHLQSFAAADAIRAMGILVALGGPHATYHPEGCLAHADYVSKGGGFRTFRRILNGEIAHGLVFDDERLADGFPVPDRATTYERYPDLAQSPIKSIIASDGCPFQCSYCNSPQLNEMYGGFNLSLRPMDEVIREAQEIRDRWPAKLIYFQDDVFGFKIDWLEELARRWPVEVGIPWHCQIRLEMTKDERRLDLFRAGGCTGITLAIESGNDWLRRYVLQRGMADDLIVAGIRKVQARGLTLRTEQILAVPFSDLSTDLETLELNTRLNPEMAWSSILAPYRGLPIGELAKTFGMYDGDNDSLTETFFDSSVLKHVRNGWRSMSDVVRGSTASSKDNPLMRMRVLTTGSSPATGRNYAVVCEAAQPGQLAADGKAGKVVPRTLRHATIEYLTPEENRDYCLSTVSLHHIFYVMAKMPRGHAPASRWVRLPKAERTWAALGNLTRQHLEAEVGLEKTIEWTLDLKREMGLDELPTLIAENPWYFVFLPSGGEFARALLAEGVLEELDPFPKLATRTRHWLFERALYRITPCVPAIAHSGEGSLPPAPVEAFV